MGRVDTKVLTSQRLRCLPKPKYLPLLILPSSRAAGGRNRSIARKKPRKRGLGRSNPDTKSQKRSRTYPHAVSGSPRKVSQGETYARDDGTLRFGATTGRAGARPLLRHCRLSRYRIEILLPLPLLFARCIPRCGRSQTSPTNGSPRAIPFIVNYTLLIVNCSSHLYFRFTF